MRLTNAAEYAVRCMLYLSLKGKNVVVSRNEIGRKMDIPGPFLGKIAQQLAHARFIEIVQGAKGGYRLLVAPEELTLLQVVEAVIGEIVLNDCLIRPDACRRSPGCPVHGVWKKARNQLRETLSSATFADMTGDESCIHSIL